MATLTANYIDDIKDSIAHLLPGQTRLFHDVTWSVYKQLAEELCERHGVRLTYDRGRLEIMSPLAKHEAYKDFILRLLDRLSTMTNVEFESLGSTTFDQEWMDKGIEPDNCFYIANAAAIIGNARIDLNTDPPPDIAVEIDISHPSISKLPIYEEMRVPEVWLSDEKLLKILRLSEVGYVESLTSQSFPFITGEVLTQYLEQSKTKGQSAVLRAFQDWVKAQLASEN